MPVRVLINGVEAGDKAALAYGARAAKRLHSEFYVFSAMPRPERVVMYTGIDGAVAVPQGTVEAARAQQEMCREAIDALFANVLQEEGIAATAATVQHFSDIAAHRAVSEAILGGPLIFPRAASEGDHELGIAFNRVLMEARLPLIRAANEAGSLGTAIIAWDGSAEASRAVRFHLELINLHDRVIIAQNPDDISDFSAGPHSDPAKLEAWLKAHNIHAELASFSGKIADGLQELSAKESADLIVAGAYGHSRIGEFLFGGATRGLLKSAAGPALALAH